MNADIELLLAEVLFQVVSPEYLVLRTDVPSIGSWYDNILVYTCIFRQSHRVSPL